MLSAIIRRAPIFVEGILRGGCTTVVGTIHRFIKVTAPLCYRLSLSHMIEQVQNPECASLQLGPEDAEACFSRLQSLAHATLSKLHEGPSFSFCTQQINEKLFKDISRTCHCAFKEAVRLLSMRELAQEEHTPSVFHGAEQILNNDSNFRLLVTLIIAATADSIFVRFRGPPAHGLFFGGCVTLIAASLGGASVLQSLLGYYSYRAIYQCIVHRFPELHSEIGEDNIEVINDAHQQT